MPTKLADRVTELEREVAELKDVVRKSFGASQSDARPRKAWRKTVGAYENSPFFDDVVRLGRNWRRLQPKCLDVEDSLS